MKINEAKESIKQIYKTNYVTALISERGVGKTSAYKQCAEELGIGYIDIYAAALEGPDFMGLPDKNKQLGITQYLAPQFLPTDIAIENNLYPAEGILVLEEINRVSTDTISVLYPLLLDRKINGHSLAKGWRIGITMNPDNLNYFVNTLDDAMLDRFISIAIEPDIKSYISYSKNNNYNNDVLSYLDNYPDMLLIVNKDSSVLTKSPTPRGWSKVQDVLNTCKLEKNILQEIISGIVGPTTASSFFGFIDSNLNDLPSTDDLLLNYSLVQDKISVLIINKSFDILSTVISSIISKIDISESKVIELNKFLNDLPEELQLYFFKEMTIKKPDILIDISEYLDTFENITDSLIDLIAG